MKKINFRAYAGYPMLQMVKNSDRQIEFVDTDQPEVGDEMELFTANLDSDFMAVVRTEIITAVNQSRSPRGDHKNPNALWYNVSF